MFKQILIKIKKCTNCLMPSENKISLFHENMEYPLGMMKFKALKLYSNHPYKIVKKVSCTVMFNGLR